MLWLLNEIFLAKIRIIRFSHVVVNTYVPIIRDLDAHGGRKLEVDGYTDRETDTNTWDNYRNPRCACALMVNYTDTIPQY